MKRIAKYSPLVLAAFFTLAISCERENPVKKEIVEQPEKVEVVTENNTENNEATPTSSESQYTPTQTKLSLNEGEMTNITPGNEFSFRYFAKEFKDNKPASVISSPLSVQFICGMLGNQIPDNSALTEMLGIKGGIEEVNSYFNKLISDVAKIGEDTRMIVANALMKDIGVPDFPEEFLGKLKNYYLVDYSVLEAKPLEDQPIGERPEDLWVKGKTSGLIDRAPEPVLPEMASLFNVLCFNGTWSYTFDPNQTSNQPFYIDNNTTVEKPLMSRLGYYPFYKGDSFSAAILPFGNASFLFTILLPNTGKTLDSVIEGMSAKTWNTIRENLLLKKVSLSIPRFSVSFNENNVFSYIDDSFKTSYLNQMDGLKKEGAHVFPFMRIKQKTIVEINEEGASAAATSQASGVIDNKDSEQIEVFNANHPFAFMISEAGSGLVLFIGTYSGS